MWTEVWTILNSPVAIAAISAALIWLLSRLYTAKPFWRRYEGTLIAAVKYAEHLIPDNTTNVSLRRLDCALQYAIKVIEGYLERTPTQAEINSIREGIQLTHSDLEQHDQLHGGTTALLLLLCALCVSAVSGCYAATVGVDLQGYDVIQQAAAEARRGLEAYDLMARSQALRDRDNVLAGLQGDLADLIAEVRDDPNSALHDAEPARLVSVLDAKLADLAEQERRRQAWYAATSDNLEFVIETAGKQRNFALYRADIEEQWRAYLQSEARSRLAALRGRAAAADLSTASQPAGP